MVPPQSASEHKEHVVVFPFMAQGHTIPLIELSKALSSNNIKVTIITTQSNAKQILNQVSKHPNITLTHFPFPTNVHGLPIGCENTFQLPSMALFPAFLLATKSLQKPFQDLLRRMSESHSLPLCVVSDFFLGFTLKVCQAFGVPRIVFHGMGVSSLSICKAYWTHISNSDPVDLPGLNLPFALTISDLASLANSADVQNPMTQLLDEAIAADSNSWAVIVNTFVELEIGPVSFFESFYNKGARAWCVGPLSLYDHDSRPSDDDGTAMRWLDDRGRLASSVLYASFGTQSDVPEAQLDEVAYGLEESGEAFVWVVRSTTWSPPNDIKERLNDKGLIMSGWVDQRRVLSHRAVGGFLSHCGWNSVLEGLSYGVPILAWPMLAEQVLNAKLVVEGHGAGIRLTKTSLSSLLGNNDDNNNVVVSRQAICKGVRELMGSGERARSVREKANALGRAARRAVQNGGSSLHKLNELMEKLRG